MLPEMLQTLPGYTGDVQMNREEARALMQKAGYGADKRIAVKIRRAIWRFTWILRRSRSTS